MRDYLITYDVKTETQAGRRRLRKVAKLCVDHGQRVQNSVFECRLTDVQLDRLRADLLRVIDLTEDSLRLYRLSNRERQVEAYGIDKYVDMAEPMIL